MIQDAQTLLSDAQALTATAVSTNTFDSGAAANDTGTGEPVGVEFTVDVAADTASGDETYQLQIIQSANANLSSQDVLVQTDTSFITRATLIAGAKIFLPLPPGLKTKRYLGARYVLAGTTPTLTVTAALVPAKGVDVQKSYPKGYTITG